MNSCFLGGTVAFQLRFAIGAASAASGGGKGRRKASSAQREGLYLASLRGEHSERWISWGRRR